MSKGHSKHQERHHSLSQFGKDLVRRCGSKCELCEAHGVKLGIYEVPPVAEDPDYDHCIMICEHCSAQLNRPKTIDPSYWRFLATSMWSTLMPVKVISVVLLQQLAKQQSWAAALLEQLYMQPEEQAWADQIDLFSGR
ncbi:phnA protein [Amphritea sp. 2_MG-2023]|jgi:protein PhnA|uniref:phnA protein n=1 Tax=Amphritea TaxID=515417 RepID=UPI001C070197|nr:MULTISPECIES: phnA protein [Amphritea]MBU2965362.1 phnA protein [Amphritea atlantica]MDO6420007.1 phnA protein [Amphritea sp. 2_MG-2023]MDX2422852.1 phnA protein [Amphritea sp.]